MFLCHNGKQLPLRSSPLVYLVSAKRHARPTFIFPFLLPRLFSFFIFSLFSCRRIYRPAVQFRNLPSYMADEISTVGTATRSYPPAVRGGTKRRACTAWREKKTSAISSSIFFFYFLFLMIHYAITPKM